MAWTTPRTWVTGEVVTAALFNAQLRDNFLVASTHAHGGAAGDGNDELMGVDSATFDFVGDPSAPGASKVIVYAKAGGVFYREGAAGGVLQISDAAHTHTFVEHTEGENNNGGAGNITGVGSGISPSGTKQASFTLTITDTVIVVASGVVSMETQASSWDLRLSIAGTDVDTDLSHSGGDVFGLKGSLARTANATVICSLKNTHATNTNNGNAAATAIAINI